MDLANDYKTLTGSKEGVEASTKFIMIIDSKSKNKSYFYKKGESNKFLYISPFFVKKSLDYMRFFLRKNLYKKNIWYRILNKEEVET